MEQTKLFKEKFDDIHCGSMFINQEKTHIYIVSSMSSQYLSGWMLIDRCLDSSKKFTECCYIIKQTSKMTHFDVIQEMQKELWDLDSYEHLKEVCEEQYHESKKA